MSSHDHDFLVKLFLEASKLEPSSREAFLDRVCAGEPDLRVEIESLLAHESQSPSILETG